MEDSQKKNFELRGRGRPVGCKDKIPRKRGAGRIPLNPPGRQQSRIGTGTKHKNHPSKPYVTAMYQQTEFLEMKLTSHRKKVIDTYNPLGQFEEERENPFKITFK